MKLPAFITSFFSLPGAGSINSLQVGTPPVDDVRATAITAENAVIRSFSRSRGEVDVQVRVSFNSESESFTRLTYDISVNIPGATDEQLQRISAKIPLLAETNYTPGQGEKIDDYTKVGSVVEKISDGTLSLKCESASFGRYDDIKIVHAKRMGRSFDEAAESIRAEVAAVRQEIIERSGGVTAEELLRLRDSEARKVKVTDKPTEPPGKV